MDDLLDTVISLPVLFGLCVASGTFVPLPEDVPVLVAGIASAEGVLPMVPALLVSTTGVLCRDLLFYGAGRVLGEQVLARPTVVRVLGATRLEKAKELLAERGAQAVFMGRFLIGFRTPVFLTAGALGVPLRSFLMWDTIGLSVMIPLMFFLGFFLGESALVWLQWVVSQSGVFLLGLLVLALVGGLTYRWQRSRSLGS